MIMKKNFNSLFVIIAAMVTFAGCAKDEVNSPASSEAKSVQFFAESIESRTAFGTSFTEDGKTKYPTLWTENDSEVKLLLNLVAETQAEVVVSDDSQSASFIAKFDKVDEIAGPYKFSVVSPASAYLGKNESRFAVTIPTSQKPLANSVDESAQILYAVSESFEEMPESVSLQFKHFTAYGNLSFINLNLGDAKVTSVAITSSVDFANRWNYYVETGVFEENSGASTITLETTETENLWFACAPIGSMDQKTLTFTINTDKGPLSKEVTLSGNKYNFEAGHIAKMTVDMKGIEFAESKVYELVTDASDLTVDSKIIIVAAGSNQALSTTQNGNNRAQAAVTKSSDKSTITDPGNDVQVLTIGEGATEETISLSTGEKYLYAPGGGNYLRETTTLNNNASWSVTVTEAGVATIKANRDDRNWLRYNSSNNPPIFSCYTSGQTDVAIYKLQGSGSAPLPKLAAPTVTATLNDDETGIDVSWTEVANATSYVISGIGEDVTVEDATSYSFTELSSGTYTITVTAKAEGYKSATSVAASATVPYVNTGSAKTYTLTITKADFNTTSYTANNNTKTSIATADDGSTFEVKWYSNQVMQQSSTMQWQKSKGAIYNTTDLGTIVSVTVNSTAGTFTKYIGSSQEPTSETSGGYFQIKVGSATGKVTSIEVKFQI